VGTFARPQEAEVARGLLESEGIPVAMLGAHVAALGLGPAVAAVRLLVPEQDAALARDLLRGGPGLDDGPEA
jgi:hypothetical protein